MLHSRRRILHAAAAGTAFAGLARYAGAQSLGEDGYSAPGYASEVAGYGPLRRDPAEIFDLPEGFSYRVLSKAGERMDDGLLAPGKMDGMGCFPVGRNTVALSAITRSAPRLATSSSLLMVRIVSWRPRSARRPFMTPTSKVCRWAAGPAPSSTISRPAP